MRLRNAGARTGLSGAISRASDDNAAEEHDEKKKKKNTKRRFFLPFGG